MLKAPGTERLKLKYDEVVSSFAFNFNLRRYIMLRDSGSAFMNELEVGVALCLSNYRSTSPNAFPNPIRRFKWTVQSVCWNGTDPIIHQIDNHGKAEHSLSLERVIGTP